MLRGELYDASDPELLAARVRASRLCRDYNALDPADTAARRARLAELLGGLGARTVIEPPLLCDYGTQIVLADDVFINFNCVFLDAAAIGSRVWIGGGAIVLPGISIGDDTVVDAGSVVTRSLPAGVLADGNPCRVLRPVDGAG